MEDWSDRFFLILALLRAQVNWDLNVCLFNPTIDCVPEILLKSLGPNGSVLVASLVWWLRCGICHFGLACLTNQVPLLSHPSHSKIACLRMCLGIVFVGYSYSPQRWSQYNKGFVQSKILRSINQSVQWCHCRQGVGIQLSAGGGWLSAIFVVLLLSFRVEWSVLHWGVCVAAYFFYCCDLCSLVLFLLLGRVSRLGLINQLNLVPQHMQRLR